ncbi:MAG: tRNA (N6-threonylcarbamoyladenosine(37)-N6)-methyltransferase TrmO [Eubacterium sp.]|nr:tRNA (N6-threonylcarbamoyladenosine(37)-N6)-methyltransferase TrmO [Eubacterium sp.]
MEIKPIAKIYNDFPTKFGIPRQSGRVKEIAGKIVFEKEFRNENALRGIEQFSHLWLIWEFTESKQSEWSATVRPPRLGGNKRIGVFATRSPFRPNSLGLSCVKLERIEKSELQGTILIVSGADLMNGTPIYDIKPYIPYTDCINDASGGFAEENSAYKIDVEISDNLLEIIPEEKRKALIKVLKDDPRPAYKSNCQKDYGFYFSDYEIKFKAANNKIIVTDIIRV